MTNQDTLAVAHKTYIGDFFISEFSAQNHKKNDKIYDFEVGIFGQQNNEDLNKKDNSEIYEIQKEYSNEDVVKEQIAKLNDDITKMRNELYKGKYDTTIAPRKNGKMTDTQSTILKISGGLGAGIGMGWTVKNFGWSNKNICTMGTLAMCCVILPEVFGFMLYKNKGIKKDEEFMMQCEQENPVLYQQLQQAEELLSQMECKN